MNSCSVRSGQVSKRKNVCVYVCICVCVSACLCLYVFVCVSVSAGVCVFVCACMCLCVCLCQQVSVSVCVFVCACMCLCVCLCQQVSVSVCVFVCACMCLCLFASADVCVHAVHLWLCKQWAFSFTPFWSMCPSLLKPDPISSYFFLLIIQPFSTWMSQINGVVSCCCYCSLYVENTSDFYYNTCFKLSSTDFYYSI